MLNDQTNRISSALLKNYPPEVVWDSPGTGSCDSMPLGNGDIGLNVWTEASGDLLFYISKTDCWDEHGRLLKLGKIRLTFDEGPFSQGFPFLQILRTSTGEIEIRAGKEGERLTILLWVDANRPAIHVEATSEKAFSLSAKLELWRTATRELLPAEHSYPIGLLTADERTPVFPDSVLDAGSEALAWCHRNRDSVWRRTLEHQGLGELVDGSRDPLLGLTSGAVITATGLIKKSGTEMAARAAGKAFGLSIHPLTCLSESEDAWLMKALSLVKTVAEVSLSRQRDLHRTWWHDFWERSVISIQGSEEAEAVSLAYNLQRFLFACSGRGSHPIKFNGSLFTVDGGRHTPGVSPNEPDAFDADYRRWGGGYWFQNTRLAYWPMLMAGDFEMLRPFFRMYLDALPLAEARTKAYFGHEGAFFPETMTFWGAYLNQNYGYDRTNRKPGEVENGYIRRYWSGALELITLMLDYAAFTADDAFLQNELLPFARPILAFYREHYPRLDDEGKTFIKPAQSLENWHEAVNPLPDLAGLRWVLDGLLMRDDLVGDDRATWQRQRELLPELPSRSLPWNKGRFLLPALVYDLELNSETPELYAVFPYRIYGLGKPDLPVAVETFQRRTWKNDIGGWRQDAIQAALLGLTDEARAHVVRNARRKHAGSRFPAFWGPNFDWIPDQDHGGVLMIALQRMLMQCDEGKIRLLPAWPKEWHVEFRLHAPGRTVVEGHVRQGRIVSLQVTPSTCAADVVTEAPTGDAEASEAPAATLITTGELPSLLTFADGSPVASAADWPRRRQEVSAAILDLAYGGMPPPAETSAELLHPNQIPDMEGAQFLSYRLRTGPEKKFSFLLTLCIPPGDGPFPVVLTGDGCWRYANDVVMAEVLGRGLILAQFNRTELAPDAYHNNRTSGIYPLYPELPFGALSAWAWGYHRCVDALTAMPCVDAARIAITGHSRGGKAVLLAGATDERIALVGANNSGAGGAGCYRILGQGSEILADLIRAIPYWFGPQLSKYVGRENELPFDQHFLKALVAPRALLTTEGLDDVWANPIGTWHTHRAAREVYRLLGVGDRIGIAFRAGGHGHGLDDWKTFLDFLDWQVRGNPARRYYDGCPFDEGSPTNHPRRSMQT